MVLTQKYLGNFTSTTNTGFTTAQDTWYDVLVRCDGDRIEVWRGPQGGTMTLAFDWELDVQNTIRGAVFTEAANVYFRLDDIAYAPADPLTTTFAYNDANELTSMTENGVLTTSFTYDDWGRTTSA